MNENKEALISIPPKTDFEKLLFAENYIEFLKKELRLTRLELGQVRSELLEIRELNEGTNHILNQRTTIIHLQEKLRKVKLRLSQIISVLGFL